MGLKVFYCHFLHTSVEKRHKIFKILCWCILLLYGYSSCPAFSQFDLLIIRQDTTILPIGFSCWTKLKTHVDQNCLKFSEKCREVIKLGKMLLIKLVNDYFSENSRWVFRQFSESFKINIKLWENDFWTNFVKNIFLENCRKILVKCLEYFRFCHIISYLLTGLLVLYHEILGPRFYAHASQTQSVLQNLGLSISWYGPCIRLINSEYEWS